VVRKASCFRWLHAKCEKWYRARYHSMALPVIILSTITGFANVRMSEFIPERSMPVAQAIIGGVNLLAGVLGTLQSFLKVAETICVTLKMLRLYSTSNRDPALVSARIHSIKSIYPVLTRSAWTCLG